ncbi:MAG: efflux RND transporter permease subunit [Pseudomonadota bacterium]
MTGIIDAAFSRTRVVMTALVVSILFGLAAFQSIPREAEPDIAAPFVLVRLPLPGISPEDAERLLVRPTELEIQGIEGLEQMDSLAYDGAAQMVLQFATTTDITKAVNDVREAVDRAKADYPADAEEPVVEEFNVQNQFPILTVIVSGDASERALYGAARRLKDRLESVGGVLEARLTGAREELLEVILDPDVLESYNLTELEVANAITGNNRLITAGAMALDDGRFAVKTSGLVKTAADLMAIPVRANGDRVVTIGDVAEVRRTFKDRNGHALFNGAPAIGVEITKRAGANIVETIEQARTIAEEEAQFWPPSVRPTFINDRSVEVRDNLEGLTASVVTAIVLVMIVVVAALGTRSAVMVGIAIPTSFLMGFLLLALNGYTLNMMVMFGLVLSVGMLVDGAIVIVEYADRRMAEGCDRRNAYMEASKRMFWPVITSTATTLAAFLPFLFWDDMTGEFMKFLPLTLIFVLLASLLVALIFLPVLGSVMATPAWLKKRVPGLARTPATQTRDLSEVDPTTINGVLGVYARFLKGVIQRPIVTVAASLAVVVGCVGAFVAASPEVEFFIRTDNEEALLVVLARGNLSADQKIEIVQEVADRVADHPAIENLYLQTGPQFSRNTDDYPAETIGQVSVDLVYYSERDHSRIILQEFRKRVADVPGVVVEVRQREGGPPIGKDVQVEITSASLDDMFAAARTVRDFAQTATTTVNGREVLTYMDAEDSLPLPGVEWSVEVDRALAGRYGLNVQQAGAALQFVTSGLLVDRYRPDDAEEEIDIRVRYPEDQRTITGLETVRVQTEAGSIPLSNFVQAKPKAQVDRVTRRDGRRIVEIKANGNTRVDGHEVSQDVAIAEMRAFLESGALGDTVSWAFLGADEETAEALAFLQGAMAAAMFLIAMILLLEFNSFYHAFLTLLSVILSVFGVLLGIALTGQYMSVIMTGVGVVALAGIVVNNNIVLIDTYQSLRKKGLPVENAVLRTAAQRARPVLLTTATTILGLLPMVFELNVNFADGTISRGSTTSGWWVLLSSAVCYGLAFATLLTLILTPALLAAPAVLGRRFKKGDAVDDAGAANDPARPEEDERYAIAAAE